MSRWFGPALLCMIPLVPLFAPSARAASITTYGSIILTALGNDTFRIDYQDKPGQPAAGNGGVVGPTGGVTSSGGASVANDVGSPPALTPAGNSGGSGGNSGVASPSMPGSAASGDPSIVGNDPTSNTIPDSGVTTTGTQDPPPPSPFDVTNPGPGVTDPPAPPPPGAVPDSGTTIPPDAVPMTAGPTAVAQTPEPASLTLLALGGLGSWIIARRRRL